MKLCHYPYHYFIEGVCSECERTEEEIKKLYEFYYPSFFSRTAVSTASSGDDSLDLGA